MIPRSRPQEKFAQVADRLIKSTLWKDDKVGRLSVVAIRGYYLDTMGKVGVNDRGIYDDAIFVIAPGLFRSFNANVDPSIYRSGIASLMAPQVVRYAPGLHAIGRPTQHQAFRQQSDVIVVRDGGKGNGKPLGNGRFQDSPSTRFWINLHRGGNTTTSSEGCLTLPVSQWDEFRNLVNQKLKEHGQNSFNLFFIDNP